MIFKNMTTWVKVIVTALGLLAIWEIVKNRVTTSGTK